MKRPLDTITSSDVVLGTHPLREGLVIEIIDPMTGRAKGVLKVIERTTSHTTMRELRWYERLWRIAVTRYRVIRDWCIRAVKERKDKYTTK